MSETVQIIERDEKPEYAVVPFSEFEKMRRLAEAIGDIQACDAALADSGESVPHSVMERLVEGESPLRVRREHRSLSQSALATRARLDNTYLSQLESGRKSGSIAVLRRLANALSVEVDELIPPDRNDL